MAQFCFYLKRVFVHYAFDTFLLLYEEVIIIIMLIFVFVIFFFYNYFVNAKDLSEAVDGGDGDGDACLNGKCKTYCGRATK